MKKVKNSSKRRSRERFFETVRRVQKANQEANPDEVMQDVLEAKQAVRSETDQENQN